MTKQDTEEVLAAWQFRGRAILILFFSMTGVLVAFGLLLWQRNIKIHYQALYATQVRLNAQTQRHSVMIKSIGDGVISTNAQGQAELLNPAAEALTGWSEVDAIGKPLATVFNIISEQTRIPVDTPVTRVLREGIVVGLSNHTLLIARDGSEIPIADSAAPILDPKGTTTGVVLVFRDQTSEQNYRINLCVNARDAIETVGKLTIEADARTLDADYCGFHLDAIPGDFVLLEVSDNGCGMDRETLGKVFEPFFTTKGVGKGTGLGLATVYGIVRQNNGFINVYSEPGKGTTFKIYLPCHHGVAAKISTATGAITPSTGGETVLMVEDEITILEIGKNMLTKLGYSALGAATPGEALRLTKTHSGRIDLLVTDVVMPDMNGRDLAKQLLAIYPKLKILFMSGYTSNVIAHHGILDANVHFIQKPFTLLELSHKVHQTLSESAVHEDSLDYGTRLTQTTDCD